MTRDHLFTDDGCTYQFYNHRGFTRESKEWVAIKVAGRRTSMTCLLYSKLLN